MKVNGPGRLRFSSLKTVLSTLAYAATTLRSGQMIEKSGPVLPVIARIRSMALVLFSEQPNA